MRQMKKTLRNVVKSLRAKKALLGEKQLCFAPYWRVKGTVYRWIFGKDRNEHHVKELKSKHLDRTFPAYHGIDLGLRTLGIRPGALTLPFFDRTRMSAAGTIMKVDLPLKDAVNPEAMMRDVGLDETTIQVYFERTRLVGERYGVIYFPFWIMRLSLGSDARILVVDAVANTVTRVLTPVEWQDMWADRAQNRPAVDFGKVAFIAFKCPNCGWDLPLNRFDVIHFCRTCKRAWIEQGGRFRPVKFEVARTPGNSKADTIYLPFWVCRGEIQTNGETLKTPEDLKTFINPYALGTTTKAEPTPLRFFIPAARIRNILAADKLAAGVTRQQPVYQPSSTDRLEDLNALGTFLSPRTARRMADLLLCSLTPAGNRTRQESVKHARIHIHGVRLLLWPFHEQRLFLRDAVCGLGIQKGTLGLAG